MTLRRCALSCRSVQLRECFASPPFAAQFAQRGILDLSHALAGAAEFRAHLFQRANLPAIETVTQFDDTLFARGECVEQTHRLGA